MKKELERQEQFLTKPQVFAAGIGTGVLGMVFAGSIVGAIMGAIQLLVVPALILALIGVWKVLR